MWEASRDGAGSNWHELEVPYSTFVPGKGKYLIEELDNPSQWKSSIIRELDERGYSSSEIAKVLGENFMRVFRKVWGA